MSAEITSTSARDTSSDSDIKLVMNDLYSQIWDEQRTVNEFRLVREKDGCMAAAIDKKGDVVGYWHPDSALKIAKEYKIKINYKKRKARK